MGRCWRWVRDGVEVWDLKKQQSVRRFLGDYERVAFVPGRGTLVLAGVEGVLLYDPMQQTVEPFPVEGEARAVACSPDGTTLAVALPERVELVEFPSRKSRGALVQDGVSSLAFSADGKLLAAGHFGRRVTIWDLPSGSVFRRMRAHCSIGVSFTVPLVLLLLCLLLWPLLRRKKERHRTM